MKINLLIFLIALLSLISCTSDNKELLLNKKDIQYKIETLYSKGDLEIIDVLFASDFLSHSNLGQGIKGTQGTKEYIVAIRTAFPDLQVTVDDIMIEGNKVAIRRTFRSTNTGPIKFPGLEFPPTGKKIRWTDMGFLYFKDGKIKEAYQILDSLGVMQQLGLIPNNQ